MANTSKEPRCYRCGRLKIGPGLLVANGPLYRCLDEDECDEYVERQKQGDSTDKSSA